jgi:hypothetical protein
MDHGGGVDRGIGPIKKPLSLSHYWPLLPENLHQLAQGFHDVVGIHCGPLGHIIGVDDPFGIEKCQHHLLGPAGLDLGMMGPGWPFGSHCFDCCSVSGVWKDTADSFIVTMLSSIAIDCQWTAAKNCWQVHTLSCFWSEFKSLGAHLADFFTSPRSL